jgi:hypothetical protein
MCGTFTKNMIPLMKKIMSGKVVKLPICYSETLFFNKELIKQLNKMNNNKVTG